MTIKEMQKVLDARFLYGEELADLDAQYVFSADMMSDVLAFCGKCSVLITGLCNPQVVRTAETGRPHGGNAGYMLHHLCPRQDAR